MMITVVIFISVKKGSGVLVSTPVTCTLYITCVYTGCVCVYIYKDHVDILYVLTEG